jgi:hemolysin III
MTSSAPSATPSTLVPSDRPLLRGRFHQWAAVYALGAGSGLVAMAPTARARAAAAVYAVSLAVLFGISATYHRLSWRPRVSAWLRRADHASIFVLVGGTYTPLALLRLAGGSGPRLLLAVWTGVALGVLVSLFWPSAPRGLNAAIAVAVGWTIAPFLGEVRGSLAPFQLWLLVAGGIAYTLGALVYALRRPDPLPSVFGFHEVFHALTLLGAFLHLVAIASIVRTA